MKTLFIMIIIIFSLLIPVSAQNTETKKNTKKMSEKDKQEKKSKEADINKAKWIEKTMKFGAHKERKEAINFIPTVKNSEWKTKLRSQLIDLVERENNATVLHKAIYILNEINANEAIPSILKHLSNENEDVKIAAIYFLKELKAVETKDTVVKVFKEQDLTEDSNFTGALIDTLGQFKASEMSNYAIEKIKDNKTTDINRQKLVLFLGVSNSTPSASFLIEIYKDQDESMTLRSYAARSLSLLKSTEAAAEMKKFLDEYDTFSFDNKKKHYKLYQYTISSLVKLGDSESFERLYESLRSDSTSVRLQSIKLLKELDDKRSVDILKYKAKYDPSVSVQKAAKEALKEMGIENEKENTEK